MGTASGSSFLSCIFNLIGKREAHAGSGYKDIFRTTSIQTYSLVATCDERTLKAIYRG